MNRRGFVSMLFGGAVVVALPERRIFLPPRGGWRVADYLTSPHVWGLAPIKADGAVVMHDVVYDEVIADALMFGSGFMRFPASSFLAKTPDGMLRYVPNEDLWVSHGR